LFNTFINILELLLIINGGTMILIRDIFQLKYGKARDAKELWQEGKNINKEMSKIPSRLLTDLTGKAYTLVLEMTFDNLATYENSLKTVLSDPNWKTWYAKFVPLVESSYREIFTIVE
jgi:NIPSNAP